MAATTTTKKKTGKKTLYYEGVGRRKESVSRVRLYIPEGKEMVLKGAALKKGAMVVNTMTIENYFAGRVFEHLYKKPFELSNSLERFIVTATIIGGGKVGQLEAFTLAVSRALVKLDAGYREELKKAGLLKVDARVRERRKVGMGGKARRARQSPKR
jgi:small subunit ribosomal protein S9